MPSVAPSPLPNLVYLALLVTALLLPWLMSGRLRETAASTGGEHVGHEGSGPKQDDRWLGLILLAAAW